MTPMTTVSEVLSNLHQQGYTVDFNLQDNCLVCHGNALQIAPSEFLVDKHYRFEGMSDPGDAAVVYAISSARHNLKGTLVDGYGISSEALSAEMIRALRENPDFAAAPAAPAENPVPAAASNEATPQRPAGTRPLDAPLLVLDLPALLTQVRQEATYLSGDRNALTLFKTDSLRLVLLALHAGAELKTHTAPGTISVQVLDGQLTFRTEDQTAELGVGQLLTLHTGIPHSVTAVTEAAFLLTLALGKP